MKKIAIFGAGGFGREVKTIIDAINKENENTYNFVGFFDDGFEKYANKLSKIDYYYRKYLNHSNKSEHNQILKSLDEQIEKIYLNDFLRVLNDTWQSYVKDYKSSKFDYQKDFYKTNINPL